MEVAGTKIVDNILHDIWPHAFMHEMLQYTTEVVDSRMLKI